MSRQLLCARTKPHSSPGAGSVPSSWSCAFPTLDPASAFWSQGIHAHIAPAVPLCNPLLDLLGVEPYFHDVHSFCSLPNDCCTRKQNPCPHLTQCSQGQLINHVFMQQGGTESPDQWCRFCPKSQNSGGKTFSPFKTSSIEILQGRPWEQKVGSACKVCVFASGLEAYTR